VGWPKRAELKTWLAVGWLVVTLSLVIWWLIHGLTQEGVSDRTQRMLFWEGAFLIAILFVGGVALVFLTHHHRRRHDRLQVFFSTFAHDLRTSITRLRLQAELLEEQGTGLDPRVRAILRDIQRLDLQLENSLWMSHVDTDRLLPQKTELRDLMESLRNEFSEVQVELRRNAAVTVDRRAFALVLRNIFQNSILHGKADRIEIDVVEEPNRRVRMEIRDNGTGLVSGVKDLGRQVLDGSARTTGLGLYLSRRLLERMDGSLEFRDDGRFVNILLVPGAPS
jgi:signal transduction histidine kinase